MEKYSVLWIDQIRAEDESLQNNDWDDYGFHIMKYVQPGSDLITMAKQLQPDIILMEVRDPLPDDTWEDVIARTQILLRRLRHTMARVSIVIVSDELIPEIAKTALEIGAIDYLTKVRERENKKKTALHLAESMLRKKREQERIRMLESYYRDTYPLAVALGYRSLLTGESYPLQNYVMMPQPEELFLAAIIRFRSMNGNRNLNHPQQMERIRQRAMEKLDSRWKCISFLLMRDIVLIVRMETVRDKIRFREELNTVYQQLQEENTPNVMIAMGDIGRGEQGLKQSYHNACAAADALQTVQIHRIVEHSEHLMPQKRFRAFVEKALHYVEENYSRGSLTVDEICKELGVSNAYFSTEFKKETGKTFITYLTEFRMRQAENYLLMGNEKAYMIAERVGYTDPNYFSSVFKKYYGMSPSRYRMEMKRAAK